MAEAASAYKYTDRYLYGSAIPAEEPYFGTPEETVDIPAPREGEPQARPRQRERAGEHAATQRAPSVSLFALFGAIFAGVLMLFVILAQISFNEIAGETVRLNAQLGELAEQEKRLMIQFESVVDMKEVERHAKDVLGMSKPDAGQVAVIQTMRTDQATIVDSGGDKGALSGFGAFISSLMEYFNGIF